MNSSNMKNMIVLKNLPSNLIEEAIVILKNNITITVPKVEGENKGKIEKGKNKEYIVKEAEMHICQYVSHIENHKKRTRHQKDLEKKYQKLKRITFIFAVLALLGMVVNLLK